MSHRQNGSHKSWGSQNFTVLVGTGIFFECLSLSARTFNWATTRQRSQRIIICGILCLPRRQQTPLYEHRTILLQIKLYTYRHKDNNIPIPADCVMDNWLAITCMTLWRQRIHLKIYLNTWSGIQPFPWSTNNFYRLSLSNGNSKLMLIVLQ